VERDERDLLLGRVHGHRGRSGEITLRVAGGEAALWVGLTRVRFEARAAEPAIDVEVESSRAYRDRLVLKLRGIDDSTEAARLRGRTAAVPVSAAPALPPGRYWRSTLLGLEVVDEGGTPIGVVRGVDPAPGGDLLEIERGGGSFLVPLVPQIVVGVDLAAGRIVARLPAGLDEVEQPNRSGRRGRC
jgi:16S rRNA processing protein RimM